jgi:hypothetical protein
MDDVSEDLAILYRAVTRRQGRLAYAGCITAPEARRLVQLGIGRLIDVRANIDGHADREPEPLPEATTLPVPQGASGEATDAFGKTLRAFAAPTETLLFISGSPDASHQAATLAARAGFHCALNVLDGRERYRAIGTSLPPGSPWWRRPH